jgi:hypothetical protein
MSPVVGTITNSSNPVVLGCANGTAAIMADFADESPSSKNGRLALS